MKTIWPLLLAMLLGVFVGLSINLWWSNATWESLGVREARAFLSGTPSQANTPGVGAQVVRVVAQANEFVGQVFVRLLRLSAVPIVLFSIVVGVASLGDPRRLGRLGVKTLALFLVTAVVSVTIGLIVANLVQPGKLISPEARARLLATGTPGFESIITQGAPIKSVWHFLLTVIPSNPFDALARGDLLQVIVFGVLLGAILTTIDPRRSKPVIDLCETLSEVMGRLVTLVMWLAPIAVFCLLVPVVAGLGVEVLSALGAYCLCVLGGLFLVLVLYCGFVFAFAGMSPMRFLRGLAPAQLVAFSSSSSNATLPVSLRCTIERLGVPPRVANFVLPVGATVNMDGTALYQGVATVFIAQAMGVELTLFQQGSVVFFAVLAAIGSPGIPGGSVVFLIGVLQSVGVPAQGIALILGVDRVLDMSRTLVNVSGDAAAAVVVARNEQRSEQTHSGEVSELGKAA